NNTCFINSILQCLSHSKYLNNYISSNDFEEDIRSDLNNYELTKELRKILILLRISKNNINTNQFIQFLQQYLLTNNSYGIYLGRHNDANEFLTLLLTFMHEHVSYKPRINISIKDTNLTAFDKISLKSCTTWKEHFKESYSKII
ncbi:unnamed protein product, partial [marine sediment metagenome]